LKTDISKDDILRSIHRYCFHVAIHLAAEYKTVRLSLCPHRSSWARRSDVSCTGPPSIGAGPESSLDGEGQLYPELEAFLRFGVPIVLFEPVRGPKNAATGRRTPRLYSLEHARHLVQEARPRHRRAFPEQLGLRRIDLADYARAKKLTASDVLKVSTFPKGGSAIETFVHLAETRTCFGGQRFWLQCPKRIRRRRVLFVAPQGRIACRRCFRLRYFDERTYARGRML
jgi:hypothetical protein